MATDPVELLLAGYKHWRDIGNDLLIGGLVVEVFISAAISETRKYKWLAELLAGLIVLVGVWIEVQNGNSADEVERQMRQASAEKIAHVNKEAEDARLETAKLNAQMSMAELLLGGVIVPRKLKTETFRKALDNLPTGRASIEYVDDREAILFAIDIYANLSKAGWKVSQPEKIKPFAVYPKSSSRALAEKASLGLTIRAPNCQIGADLMVELRGSPYRGDNGTVPVLHTAFSALFLGFVSQAPLIRFVCTNDESLPPDTFRIIVGPRT